MVAAVAPLEAKLAALGDKLTEMDEAMDAKVEEIRSISAEVEDGVVEDQVVDEFNAAIDIEVQNYHLERNATKAELRKTVQEVEDILKEKGQYPAK